MQVHARARVGPLGHDARNQRDVLQIQLMRQPLHGNRLDERIGNQHFLLALRRRVTVVGGLHVRLQNFADARQAAEKFHRQAVRRRRDVLFRQMGRGIVFEALADFVLQRAEHRIEQLRRDHLDFRRMDEFLVEISGEQQPQQILRDGGNGAFGRQIFPVQMVDAAHARIRRDELVCEFSDRFHGKRFTTKEQRNKDFVGHRRTRHGSRRLNQCETSAKRA